MDVATIPTASAAPGPPSAIEFDAVYEAWFPFVWRSLRRLGVAPSNVDDATQDVFLVAHRRLGDFEGRSSIKTWLFGIALRVARDHRRLVRRKGGHEALPDTVRDAGPSPHDAMERAEAARLLESLLDALDEDRRAVFVLAELEQMSAPEMSEALGVPLNTVYSRLRAARADFEKALARHQRRQR